MSRSTAWSASTEVLKTQPRLASVIARLMIVCNDISIAAFAIDDWQATGDRKRLWRKRGALMYHSRVLLSHVREGLKIVQEISDNPTLRSAVNRCDPQTIVAFRDVEAFASDASKWRVLKLLRDSIGFHYDEALISEVLAGLLADVPDVTCMVSMGREPLDWHFELADRIVDRAVVRRVYTDNLPRSPRRREVLEALSIEHQEIARKLTEFAGHFVRASLQQ